MKFYFDYFYYRITKFFSKYPADKGIRAICLIGLTQSLFILSVVELSLPLFLHKSEIKMILSHFIWLAAIVVFVSFFLGFLNYNGKYPEYERHWRYESKTQKSFKGAAILLSSIASFIIFDFVTSWLYHFVK